LVECDEGRSYRLTGWSDYIHSNTAKRQSLAYAGFCQRGSLPLFQRAHKVGGLGILPPPLRELLKSPASQSPLRNCRAAVVVKNATRRRVSQIISASVVNASSRRRRRLWCSDAIRMCW